MMSIKWELTFITRYVRVIFRRHKAAMGRGEFSTIRTRGQGRGGELRGKTGALDFCIQFGVSLKRYLSLQRLRRNERVLSVDVGKVTHGSIEETRIPIQP